MGDRLIAPSRFNKQCVTVIAKYVESQDELIWERSGFSKVIFICKNKTNPIHGGASYLLCVAGSSNLFVHCDLTYTEPERNTSVERNFVFQGISLQFYYGANYCFCRAEWDLKDKPERLEHPQPHWHWGTNRDIGNVVDYESGFELTDNFSDEGKMPEINFSELHYAMNVKWFEKGENNLDFSFQNLIKWLENTLVMVIDQYNYQVSKKGFVSVRNGKK